LTLFIWNDAAGGRDKSGPYGGRDKSGPYGGY
jgi:hypothetical protein